MAAGILFAATAAAWLTTVSLRPRVRLYLRFSATLLAAMAVSVPLGMSDAAALFVLPLAASALMIAALARFAAPMPALAASLALVLGFAGGLGAMLSGHVLLALAPVILAALAIIAAALNGVAVIGVLAGVALLGSGLVLLEEGARAGYLLFCAAALVGLAQAPSARKKSALAIQQ